MTLALILNRPCLTIRNLKIVESGEWPWPFIKMEKSKSANGQIQKLAIHFEFGHSLILAIPLSGPVRWTLNKAEIDDFATELFPEKTKDPDLPPHTSYESDLPNFSFEW